jgi:general L-amino acid transport system substrate-binding protein
MTKRFFAIQSFIVASLIVVSFALAACTQEPAPSAATSAPKPATTAAAQPAAAPAQAAPAAPVAAPVTGAPAAPAAAAPAAPAAQPVQQAASGATLKQIKDRGKLICGVNQELPGFGYLDEKGQIVGFDPDYCKALAAAIFGDPTKVEYRPTTSVNRFTFLQSGEIDVLMRNATHTLQRDAEVGLWVPTTFYDGNGMIVRKDSGIKELKDLNGASICIQGGSTTERNVADAMAAVGAKYTPVVFETADQAYAAYEAGRCQAEANDKSAHAARRTLLKNPSDHILLDATFSKEPLGPAVRRGDGQWFSIVTWVVYATIDAEELGVTQANVDQMKSSSTNPEVRRLLGLEGDMGKLLGLDNAWGYNLIKAVGSYKDIYDRNLGPNTKVNLPRGLNSLWKDGGILYAMPVR